MPPISSPNLPPPIPKGALQDDLARKRLWYAAAAILVILLLLLLMLWFFMSGMGGGGLGQGGGGGGNTSGRLGTGEGTSLSSSSLPPSSLGNTEGSTSGDNAQPKDNASSPTENASGTGSAVDAEPADESGGTEMALRIYNPTEDSKPATPVQGDANRPPASGTAGAGKGIQSIDDAGSNPFIGSGPPAKTTVYVVDASNSMLQRSSDSTRQNRVNEALIRAIENLKPDQRFKVYFFADTHYTDNISKGLMPASKGNKEKVIAWINQIGTKGDTRPLSAMLEALELRPERIIMMSDGEFDETIVPVITKANKSKRTRIDCFGMDEDIESLRKIAEENKGHYSQVN